MTALEEFIARVRREVDATLDELIPKPEVEPARLHEGIRWSVFAGGKRIRPAILMAVGETFGAAPNTLVNSAAAIEMIHTYSLIHDDLPAMDDDDLRRGKATCHRQFGEATAILAGDVLQTLAFKAVAEDRALATETRLRLISIFADASGTPAGMVSGQQLDLSAEGNSLTIDEIEQIHRQKTGALISAAALCGAVIAGAGDDETAAIEQYAGKLGLLFQITDDLLDVTQETGKLGKTAGKDAAAQKATYPAHYGVDETRRMAMAISVAARDALSPIDKDTRLLNELVESIVSRTA